MWKQRSNATAVLAVLVACVCTHAAGQRVIYLAPNGDDAAAGTAEAPRASLNLAAERAQPGDVIRLAGGTYHLIDTVKCHAKATAEQPIRVEPAGTERPVLDFSKQEQNSKSRGVELHGDYWHLVGIEIAGAGDNGINLTGAHNTVERCLIHDCRDTGVQISGPGAHNLIVGCDSFRNVDFRTHGENADGFAAKFEIGPGNVFRECRAWENADDGWDLWRAPQPVRIERCVAFRNGVNVKNVPGYTGNGNGFKLGGNYVPAAHVVIGCVAFDQPKRGFDQNNNTGPLTIEDCVAYRCEAGFYLPAAPRDGSKHTLTRCVTADAPNRLADNVVQVDNHWALAGPAALPATQPTTRATTRPVR